MTDVSTPVVLSPDDSKKPWQSKTLWTNVIIAVVAIASPPAHAWISAHPEAFAAAFGVINVILRMVTKDAIQLS